MSLEAVQRIMGRAVTDAAFREALVANPDEVLGSRDVTPQEIDALKAMDWGAVSAVGLDLEQRISRFGLAVSGCH